MPDQIMDEQTPREPLSTLKRPWSGPVRILAWFLLLMVSVFAVICAIALLTDRNVSGSDLVAFALIVSISLAVAGLAGFWFFRWVRSWKNFRRFLFLAACLVTLLLLAYAEENWRGKRAWQKHKQHWEVQGEKFDLAAFIPAEVPEDKNFALTPLLKPLLDFTVEGHAVWRDTNGLARVDRTSALLPGGRRKRDNFDLGSLQKGTFADLGAWAEFYRGNTNYPQAAADAAPAQVVLVALGKFDPEIKELREAAATRPWSRFPVAYNYEPPWAILLPHLSRIKGLTVLPHVRAVAELEAHSPGEALADLKLAFRLSESLRDEPILIDHLVRLATLGIGVQTVREGIARHAWTETQLAEIETYLSSVNLLAEYKHAMRGELAFGIRGLDYLRRNGNQATEMFYSTDDGRGASAGSFRPMPSGWYYQNMLTISRMHHEFTLPAVDEQARRVFPEISEKGTDRLVRMRAGPYTIFAKMLLPALQKAVVKCARMQTCADAARVACALERYRIAKGTLPASLDSLTPQFIDRIPNDVIDGQPLRYRLDPNGDYRLYSIGWNRTDDGGELSWSRDPHKGVLDDTKGDWVWTMASK